MNTESCKCGYYYDYRLGVDTNKNFTGSICFQVSEIEVFYVEYSLLHMLNVSIDESVLEYES